MNEIQPRYVGFWARFGAFLIDSILASIVLAPFGRLYFGLADVDPFRLLDDLLKLLSPVNLFYNAVLPAIALILFWIFRQASPGKMVIGAKIVDVKTLGKPTTGQMIGRYFGYYLSTFVFLLGFFWVGWDARKQGWHDKLAGTLVIRSR
jgi:uncharacterized RDD family membrane protein YckC